MLLPINNTLFLPFEVETYWIEHGLLLAVPLFVMADTPAYDAVQLFSLSEILHSYAVWVFYHFIVMHWMAYFTLANVGKACHLQLVVVQHKP